jgi:uncharacterized cupredoxin-like copper-binding protein
MTCNPRGTIPMTPTRPHASVGPIRTLALAGATAVVLAWGPVQAAGEGHTHGHHPPAAEQGHGSGHGHAGHMAFGHPGDPSEVDRTIEIEATDDMMFEVSSIDVKDGETIRFIIRNVGEIDHDFTIGTPDVQEAHQQEMMKMMEAGTSHDPMHGAIVPHDDPNAVMVHPGETKELIWTFTKADNVEFGCNVPGHYEAGMKGTFNFVPHQAGQS